MRPSSPAHTHALSALAARLRALPPSCGPVRLVAIDGHAGSGKTTFAAALAGELDGAPVVHLDDLATHEQFFDWTQRLEAEVLVPLSRGATARHRVYDWTARRFDATREVPPAPVVLVEGVGSGRRALRPHLAHLVWMDLPAAVARARAEAAHFAADPSRPSADVLIHGASWEINTFADHPLDHAR